MLPERMVGIAARTICFQDSGQLWEWVSCSGFRGDIACQSPLAWSDRGRPPGTNMVCSNPGWPCQLRYAAAARLPTACSGPGDHPDAPARSASLPASTHGLPATCATTWDRRPGMGTRSGDPLPNQQSHRSDCHPLPPCGAPMPCAAGSSILHFY